ncbi:helix-turn-helix transcriptional regulator [Actinokineospora sp. UTMC 2448]|uniref:helix-turn-helix domain-containing protein n=1 Tax=Actinokineospora sp. UTMC 2448 TaxID=2268449 RepID=UPI00216431D9|nr:helix-turn-helix transcriptional regulator [Actinokineospora sp. UTMC 2448]UVS81859.1 hypothetical protein Actkin_05623 [Actinokineospora sp. UTMC 2448]
MNAEDVTRAAGLELRKARIDAGLTLAQLCDRLPSRIQVPTLAGYETGHRSFTVGRFVEICASLGRNPAVVILAALRRAKAGVGTVVDLQALARAEGADRAVLRQWARFRLETDQDGVVVIDTSTLREMAVLCGMPPAELTRTLADFWPS